MSAKYRPTVREYREAVCALNALDLDTPEWNLQSRKLEALRVAMLLDPDYHIRYYARSEIVDGMYSLCECGFGLDEPDVAHGLWLLETFGFKEDADELRQGWNE